MPKSGVKTVRVGVPATSANLGPGFDCLALALDLWNEAEFAITDGGLSVQVEGEGAGVLPTGPENLVYKAFEHFHREMGQNPPAGLCIRCVNRIPMASGLGSSAAAIVAGLLGANAFSDDPMELPALLELAAQLDDHPDNSAACLYGGLVMVVKLSGGLLARSVPVARAGWRAALAVPEFDFPTREARAVLPQHIALGDSVFNTSRAILLVEAFRTGDFGLLGQAMDDRLHQPHRIPLISGAAFAMESARRAGAAAVALSGAGPGLIAFCQGNSMRVARAMCGAFQSSGLTARPFDLAVSTGGAWMHEERP